MAELSHRQRQFVYAYLGQAHGNASEAARIAGYSHPDSGRRLLRNVTVRAEIARGVRSAAISAEEVLARMSEIATADLDDFIDVDRGGGWNVNLGRAKKRDRMRTLRKIRSTEFGVEIELRDAEKALIKLGEYHGLWNRQPAADVDLEKVRDKLKQNRDANAPHREPVPDE